MLVYGDHHERLDPASRLAEIARVLAKPALSHEALTSAFVDLAGVTQGIADADFRQCGHDRRRPAESALLDQLTALARALLHSWERGCAGGQAPPLGMLEELPQEVEIRLPEGFAFYALRPEAYALAARQSKLSAPPRIIGLRSIGTGLACMAAAALDAPPPFTLRPVGEPFARTLSLAAELADDLLATDVHFVIVDEGPGLSGSSFGAVADWLEDRGVPRSKIAFLPGHSNDLGPQASERHRERWRVAQRPTVALDEPREDWLDPLIGPLTQPLRDISGGAWRSLSPPSEAAWPPVDPLWERRKFLAESAGGAWLVKFAGLGRIGETKLQLARRLHDAGFGPEPAGLTGGWLVTRWHHETVPARPSITELSAYLKFRATLPAPGPGAPPELLLTMIRRNVPALSQWQPDLSRLQPRPVCTDNRMAAHEWLRLPSGHLLKADALDHHAAHDLIGCQDIAWDVAGAIVEFDLSAAEAGDLISTIKADPALIAFYQVAYTAFRIGAHRMSATTLGHWPAEQRRHLQAAERLEARLAAVDPVQHLSHVDQPLRFGVEPLA